MIHERQELLTKSSKSIHYLSWIVSFSSSMNINPSKDWVSSTLYDWSTRFSFSSEGEGTLNSGVPTHRFRMTLYNEAESRFFTNSWSRQ